MVKPDSGRPAQAGAPGRQQQDDVSEFPAEVRRRVGGALREAQIGRKCPGRCFRHRRPMQTARRGRRKAPPKAGVFATLCRRPLAGAEREPRRQE